MLRPQANWNRVANKGPLGRSEGLQTGVLDEVVNFISISDFKFRVWRTIQLVVFPSGWVSTYTSSVI